MRPIAALVTLALSTAIGATAASAEPDVSFVRLSDAPAPSRPAETYNPTRDAACPTCQIEIHVVLDNAWQQTFAPDAAQRVMDIVDAANAIISKPQSEGGLDLDVLIVGGTEFAGPQPWAASNDPQTLLNNFRAWSMVNLPTPAENRDVVILFSGANLSGATIGIAFGDVICTPNAIGVLTPFTTGTDDLAALLANLLGRILGAPIDGVGNDCPLAGYVMSQLLTIGNPPTQFSDCSIDAVNATIAGGAPCLAATPCSPADLAEPYAALDFSDVLAFLTAFSEMNDEADLASPFGVFDFSDVVAFLGAFGAGCP